ncbi:cell wall-binding repeat protein [Limosilactobacillus coleohominis 101-4-CHN]|uniref:Cell wall-binding repeat protein n=2 Tax=Limosilactobacillus coleohominis TaxID=181675 RepID=C7XV29_9LACO|nr:cell wall-binding repeat protein [Limosilactobacillus coleohominis 101-4-CHN]
MAIALLTFTGATLVTSNIVKADTNPVTTDSQVKTARPSSTAAEREQANDVSEPLSENKNFTTGETSTADTPSSSEETNPVSDGWHDGVYYRNGEAVKNSTVDDADGSTYLTDENGQMVKDHFYSQDGKMHYFGTDGREYKDKFYFNWGKTYYFGLDGARWDDKFYQNWGKTFYFGDDGARWDNRFYFNWGKAYYFGNDGARWDDKFYSNWGKVYYFGDDGARWDDKFYQNWGRTYYFGDDGARWDNRFYFNWGKTYYFGSDGGRLDNRLYQNWGHSYWFTGDGSLLTNGYVFIQPYDYYATSDGVLHTPQWFSQFTPIFATEGCSVASSAILLSTKNIYFNMMEAYRNVPQYGGVFSGRNFRGIVPINDLANFLHRYDPTVKNISGSSLSDIASIVAQGHPVLYYGYSSYERTFARHDHAKVIIGEQNGNFLVLDPCYNHPWDGPYTGGGNYYDTGAYAWRSWGSVASEYGGSAITIY